MPRSILPREGLTLEAIFVPVRLSLLQPLFTGSILLAIYQSPKLPLQWLSPDVLKFFQSPKALVSLGVLFGIGLLRKTNNVMSRLVLNNFTIDNTWDWTKEIVIITGGCSGIGALMVQRFAEKNIQVISLDVTPPPTPGLEVANHIRKTHGEPTVLINNAGIGTNKTILDETESELRRVFDVNIIAHFTLVKEFVPSMVRRNHGHVVTIASMASFLVHAQNVDYTCTKASALAFHEGLAQELKSRYNASKVRTSIIHPTWIRTPLIESLIRRRKITDLVLEPETVAEAVVNQVLSGYGAQLILPARLSIFSGLRGFPSWLQESMRNSVNRVLES
ncbi:hypothetical protein OIDMADRAFT_107737 [Oidiodendron maius Zn]|uniref:Dehydrogenase RED2 n=1 Tax=Oidiodendron maius (strain Zn) TaxID=913774 RepID=A0A0C3HX57_OIDMZ|nr:hypothetical protein OIDMADRAFT_107737 [Oidiodendron maius Zn]